MAAVVLVASLSVTKVFHDKSITKSRQLIEQSAFSQWQLDSKVLADALVSQLRDPLLQSDTNRSQDILSELSEYKNIAYVYLTDAQGIILQDGGHNTDAHQQHISRLLPEVSSFSDASTLTSEGLIHLNRPIKSIDGNTLGYLYLGKRDSDAQATVSHHIKLLSEEKNKNQKTLLIILFLIFIALFFLVFPIVFFTSNKVFSPIRTLVQRTRDYAGGDRDVSFDLKREDEFGALGAALESMVTKLEASHEKTWDFAYRDTLTELPNRRFFYMKLDEIISESVSRSEKFAMIFIDLDFFKQVNDVYGHDIGDELLKAVSKRLINAVETHLSFHAELSKKNMLISRISGDEFVLILPTSKVADVKEFLGDLYQRFSLPVEIAGRRFVQSISAGITYFPQQASSATLLMKHADIAMYQAKRMGRATYCEFNEILKSDFQRRSTIKQTAQLAFDEDQFFIEYQPIVSVKDSSVVALEALIRWNHPSLGRLWPSSFIEVFDESGMATKLSIWMLEKICLDYRQERLPTTGCRISLNITSRVFLDADFSERLIALVKEYNLPNGMLCVELRETDFSEFSDRYRYYAAILSEAGVSLWIDDFGGASSSLSLLNDLPVTALKVSGKLVRDVEKATVKPIIQAIYSLAHALDVKVIASGVESEAQLALVTELGCEYAQGFHLKAPIMTEHVADLVDFRLTNAES